MMATPGNGDKRSIQLTNNAFNSTMMASFLPAIVRKKNKAIKQRKICLLLQCLTSSHGRNPEKNKKKNSN